MKLFIKILVGVFCAAGVALVYLVFSQSSLITDLQNYNKTASARNARWPKKEPDPEPEEPVEPVEPEPVKPEQQVD